MSEACAAGGGMVYSRLPRLWLWVRWLPREFHRQVDVDPPHHLTVFHSPRSGNSQPRNPSCFLQVPARPRLRARQVSWHRRGGRLLVDLIGVSSRVWAFALRCYRVERQERRNRKLHLYAAGRSSFPVSSSIARMYH